MKRLIINREKGQSLVESALTIPLIFLLIFTFLDLGRGVYFYSTLGNAVREGARYASVNKIEDAGDKILVVAEVNGYSVAVQADSVEVKYPVAGTDPITYTEYPGTDSDYVTVSATYAFKPITPFLAQMLGSGNTISLSAESTMLLAPFARK